MLRSPITLDRTEVQPRPDMKQTTPRRLLPTPTPSSDPAAPLPRPEIPRKLAISVRLFKV
jgi:hypothetical protein